MKIKCPIIIIGTPRSGTTFLHELLSFHRNIWHLSSESHHILEGPLHPENFSYFSNRPDENFTLSVNQINKIHRSFRQEAINTDVVPGAKKLLDRTRSNRYLRKGFLKLLGRISKFYKPDKRKKEFRFLEKTPKNIVRIISIHQIFPDARYIFLKRNPVHNISSILRGWNAKTGFLYKLIRGKPRFAGSGYQVDMLNEFGISDNYWRFVLPPGWQEQQFKDLLDIAIFQYFKSNELAKQDFQNIIAPSDIFTVHYEELAANTETIVQKILSFAELPVDKYNFDSLRKIPKINTSGNKGDSNIKLEIEKRLSIMSQ